MKLIKTNERLTAEINGEKEIVDNLLSSTGRMKRELEKERRLLEMWKDKQAVEYKEMTNKYMVMNQLK